MLPPGAGAFLAMTSNQFDRVKAEDAYLILVVGVKMRNVMRRSGFGKHTDYDPEKSADLGHTPL
jgi:hypothetical protein